MGEWLSTVDPAVFWIVGAAAVVLVWLVSRASRDAQSGEPGGEPAGIAQVGMSPELIAVITAAVACARGSQAGAFRVTAIGQVQGFQTPVWGHIDRASYQTGTNVVR